jgi:hypothetical protein
VFIKQTHEHHQRYLYSFSKKIIKKPSAGFSPSLRLKEHETDTLLLNTNRATTRNLLAGFLAQPRPRGASVRRRNQKGSKDWVNAGECARRRVVVNGSLDLAARTTVLQAFLFD